MKIKKLLFCNTEINYNEIAELTHFQLECSGHKFNITERNGKIEILHISSAVGINEFCIKPISANAIELCIIERSNNG